MRKKKIFKSIPGFITILIDILLFIAVVWLMRYVQQLLNADAKINLTEVVTQNKDVISSKLQVEVNNLENSGKRIAELLGMNAAETGIREAFERFCTENPTEELFAADTEGTAYMPDGSTYQIDGRKYFKTAMSGEANISERIVSRIDGEDQFVISVPVKKEGQIIGTIQRMFTPDEMYTLCSISLFSDKGYMYIIDSEGYIIISSKTGEYNEELQNYYRILYSQGNEKAERILEEDIRNEEAGFMETTIDGEQIFSAYTPIEEIHGWYLISSVSTTAVSPNGSNIIKIFFTILSSVILIFACSTLYFLSYKNKQQANLRRIAFVDTVTLGDTYNKFTVDLRESLRDYPDRRYYLLKFDIDHFRYINNFYGFDFGDQVLRDIYRKVSAMLQTGEYLARISGDQFVALLTDPDEERLGDILTCMDDNTTVRIYFSAGLYEIKDRTESIGLMTDKAGMAAASGKGTLHKKVVLYSEAFDREMIHNEQLKQAVEEAFVNDEMVPFYQPKVDVTTGRICGAEALARWITKDGRIVPPIGFIPMCENTGMIVELDMIIFDKVLKFLRKNLDLGVECVPISVNFSRLHLLENDFLEQMLKMINEYQIPSDLIEIELTESVIFENYDTIIQFISGLHENGLSISIDDFGSGYSSLNMLKEVTIDILKIDKEFLKDAADNSKRDIIFATIAQMADHLGIEVVVEGVETQENVKLMKTFGCRIAQGYYYAKPMDEETFEGMFREGRVC